MNLKRTYSELLKDPRWQKKRLEILQRDEFTCRYCYDSTSTLHVHHIRYSGKPWEAEDKFLITVCENCHETAQFDHDEFKFLIDQIPVAFSYEHLNLLQDLVSTILTHKLSPADISKLIGLVKEGGING